MMFCQELNDEVAREDRRRVVQTRGGAEFQTTRFLHLAFYADGIVVGYETDRNYVVGRVICHPNIT